MDLLQYINESSHDMMFETINANVEYTFINESLSSSILQDIVKQCVERNKKAKEQYKWSSSPLFKELFGRTELKWDTIKDSDFEICEVVPEDCTDKKVIKARKEMENQCKEIIKGNGAAIIFLKNPTSGVFTHYINQYGSVYDFSSVNSVNYNGRGRHYKLSQKDKLAYLKGRDIYYLLITADRRDARVNQRISRQKSQEGVVDPRDSYEMMLLARKNIERYKEIIAKNKAMRQANDTIAEEVNEMLQMVMELVTEYNNNIVKYANLCYKIDSLMSNIYGERHHTGYQRGKATYSGQDGLLYYFSKYMHAKSQAVAGDSYVTMYQKEMESYRSSIETLLERTNNKYEEIKALM